MTPFVPNQSGAVFGPTAGIARDMQAVSPRAGGDLNGTASTVILFSHAGTPATQNGVPRQGNPNFGIPSPAPFGWMLQGIWAF